MPCVSDPGATLVDYCIKNDIKFLSEFSSHKKRADFAGFIMFDEDGDEIFTFGKYRGKKVTEVLDKDKGYYSWIQKQKRTPP